VLWYATPALFLHEPLCVADCQIRFLSGCYWSHAQRVVALYTLVNHREPR
jgi:hypothetical protein